MLQAAAQFGDTGAGRLAPSCSDDRSMTLRRTNFLAEAYRKLEALQERYPLTVPFSVRHLFLLPPPTLDPLGRLFFDSEPLLSRIQLLANMSKNLPL